MSAACAAKAAAHVASATGSSAPAGVGTAGRPEREQSAWALGMRHNKGDAMHDGARLQAKPVEHPPGNGDGAPPSGVEWLLASAAAAEAATGGWASHGGGPSAQPVGKSSMPGRASESDQLGNEGGGGHAKIRRRCEKVSVISLYE